MLNSKVRVVNQSSERTIRPVFERIAIEAVGQAIAQQKSLGLPNYFSRNGKIYARASNGKFASIK